MKRIKEYKTMYNVEGDIELKQLKKTYRNLVKEWHPDKFQDDAEKANAEIKSQAIIDGYHFLVSIAPETQQANIEEYKETITNHVISDFKHKGLLLEVTFMNGETYEYFGVNGKLFQKFVNSDKLTRFAKRNIFESFTYRKSKKGTEA